MPTLFRAVLPDGRRTEPYSYLKLVAALNDGTLAPACSVHREPKGFRFPLAMLPQIPEQALTEADDWDANDEAIRVFESAARYWIENPNWFKEADSIVGDNYNAVFRDVVQYALIEHTITYLKSLPLVNILEHHHRRRHEPPLLQSNLLHVSIQFVPRQNKFRTAHDALMSGSKVKHRKRLYLLNQIADQTWIVMDFNWRK